MGTMPPLGWAGTLGMIATVAILVLGVIAYHVWLDRRVRRDTSQSDPDRRVF